MKILGLISWKNTERKRYDLYRNKTKKREGEENITINRRTKYFKKYKDQLYFSFQIH